MTGRHLVERVRTDEGVVLFVVRDRALDAGPANGGLRLLAYGSEHRALGDGVRLARRMTLKHTLYATGFSGAKLTASADPTTVDRGALPRAVGDVLNSQGGRLYTGCDMNTTDADMRVLAGFSPYVLAAVDAGLATTHGVVAAVRQAVGGPVAGRAFLVHGVGKTGASVAAMLAGDGGRGTTYDHDPSARPVPGCTALPPAAAWWDRPVDVLVLCSASGVVDERVADRLRCRVVVSGANCPFTSRAVERRLVARGVLCVPDVVANAGAVICDSVEHHRPAEFRSCPPQEVYRFVAATVADRTAELPRLAGGDALRVDVALRLLLDRSPDAVCGRRFAVPERACPAPA
ncbi:Glu/Leu/Phe/Val dehydrogenase dimerization domain-containing protein [Umezawaea tangerina]|uniref:Glu/Leu/Phe/Val dehydrogenase dimerization domain-containing protein n=1 Tax=Umezawaea tangerina TaxID=84725 RepID=UPI001475CB8D|nr:Glu/Leu/Phe/Val dehydrogenase dimerization domain-containing protein [Umezawaea tangerina]